MSRTDIFDQTDDVTDVDFVTEEAQAPAEPVAVADKSDEQAAKDAEHMPAVESFKRVVDNAVEASDPSTGTVSEADLDAISQAYRAVNGGIKYKNLAKNYVQDGMKAALDGREYQKAVAFNEISDKLIVTKAEPKPAAPKVDPKVAYGERVAALELAKELLEERATEEVEGFEVPSTTSAFDQAQAYLDWQESDDEDKGEAPELDGLATAAVKLFNGKGLGKRGTRVATGTRSSYTGTRRDIAAHITSAFEGLAPGEFLTVSQIVNHTSEEYGDDHPSSGAISARLFPKGDAANCTIEGIIPGYSDEQVKGAAKA